MAVHQHKLILAQKNRPDRLDLHIGKVFSNAPMTTYEENREGGREGHNI